MRWGGEMRAGGLVSLDVFEAFLSKREGFDWQVLGRGREIGVGYKTGGTFLQRLLTKMYHLYILYIYRLN